MFTVLIFERQIAGQSVCTDYNAIALIYLKEKKKYRIRETLKLSTDADHRTDNLLFVFLVKLRIFLDPPGGGRGAENFLLTP